MSISKRSKRIAAILSAYVVIWFATNPILSHRLIQTGGATISVPWDWVASVGGQRDSMVNLRRAWLPPFKNAGSAFFENRSQWGLKPYTPETAEQEQRLAAVRHADAQYYQHPTSFEIKSPKYTAFCAQGTVATYVALDCFIAETALAFHYIGPQSAQPDAQKLLTKLR